METVGKILSITLLTIFGAAASTVYLMDSGFLDSVVSNSPTTYISEENDNQYYGNYSDTPQNREKIETKFYKVEHERNSPDNKSGNKSLWGQNYNTPTSLTEKRASLLAKSNSYEALHEKMEYWSMQYREAVKSGESKDADLAYKNYLDYKSALEIK
jgi:hypothetical protein